MMKAAVESGWRVERLAGWRVPDWLPRRDLVRYGGPLFACVVAGDLGIALIDVPAGWLPSLPPRHLGRRVQLMSVAEARKLTMPAFVKPPIGKSFAAAVYASGAGLPPADVVPDESQVLVSGVVRWRLEFRSFVLEGQVSSMSP
jgi:ATP-grasp domain, R2K clade family 2